MQFNTPFAKREGIEGKNSNNMKSWMQEKFINKTTILILKWEKL